MTPDISGYAIQRELGKGGMGLVFLARRENDDLPVALKVLPPNLLTPVTARRFQREGHALQCLSHPNIVEVYEVAARHGNHFIAMEYVKGKPLSRLVANHPDGLPLPQVLGIARAVASAVDLIHRHNMTHRDLKPGNVMLTDDGRVKLLDFGLVQMEGLTMLTATGNIIGTPAYMSPEQCGGLTVDYHCDIYAFGVLVYEMLCGQPPFRSEAVYELLEMQRCAPPPPIAARRRDVPDRLEQIVLQCLEKGADDRPQSLQPIIEVIDQLGLATSTVSGADASTPAAIHPTTPAGPLHPRPQRRPARARSALLAAVVVVSAAGVALLVAPDECSALQDRLSRWFDGAFRSDPVDPKQKVEAEFERYSQAEARFAEGRAHEERGDWPRAFEAYMDAAQTWPGQEAYLEALVAATAHVDAATGARAEAVIRRHSAAGSGAADPALRAWLRERERP